jgi:hypothetical protein
MQAQLQASLKAGVAPLRGRQALGRAKGIYSECKSILNSLAPPYLKIERGVRGDM